MKNYILTFCGIEGQLRASSYKTSPYAAKKKASVFDALQDSIGQHREAVNSHYKDLI